MMTVSAESTGGDDGAVRACTMLAAAIPVRWPCQCASADVFVGVVVCIVIRIVHLIIVYFAVDVNEICRFISVDGIRRCDYAKNARQPGLLHTSPDVIFGIGKLRAVNAFLRRFRIAQDSFQRAFIVVGKTVFSLFYSLLFCCSNVCTRSCLRQCCL